MKNKYNKIDITQIHNIQREDIVCSACGRTDWVTKIDEFLICECGHDQEDN